MEIFGSCGFHGVSSDFHKPSSRRSLLAHGAGVLALTGANAWFSPAWAQMALRPTPSQTEGPLYPIALPSDNDFDLLRNGSAAYQKGQVAWIEGVVTGMKGMPVSGAVVEIWARPQRTADNATLCGG